MTAHVDIPRPFTVPALAERWECSEGLIRKLIDKGELRSFRLGTLIRVPADEVERVECQSLIASSDLEGDMRSSIKTKAESVTVASSPRQIGRAPMPKRALSGRPQTNPPGRSVG